VIYLCNRVQVQILIRILDNLETVLKQETSEEYNLFVPTSNHKMSDPYINYCEAM